MSKLTFARKHRGRKPKLQSTVPDKLTRRQCVSKVAELYDLTGLITPIMATLKMDLHDLVKRKMEWDDVLSDGLRQVWINHFDVSRDKGVLKTFCSS